MTPISSSNSPITCSICLDELQEPPKKITSSCGHSFHEMCITGWLNTVELPRTCPICRANPVPFEREAPAARETNPYVESPILLAIRRGRRRSVARLLDENPLAVNTPCRSAVAACQIPLLYMAAQQGHSSIVSTLLDRGANIEANTDNGSTALHIAAQEGHLPIAVTLLERGANIEARTDRGMTGLHFAALEGRLETLNALLERGASIEANTDNLSTALHIAAEEGHIEIVLALLAQGADANARDREKITPLKYAKQQGHLEIVAILEPLQSAKPRNRRLSAALKYFTPKR